MQQVQESEKPQEAEPRDNEQVVNEQENSEEIDETLNCIKIPMNNSELQKVQEEEIKDNKRESKSKNKEVAKYLHNQAQKGIKDHIEERLSPALNY